jgi:uncharacterized sporulation protein YeaH/YhbH (DUF444 family)
MSEVIDRRLNGKNKSASNRERFIKRYKGQIKKSVADVVNGRSITDMDKGGDVSIPTRDLDEPYFGTGRGGVWDTVIPGNTDYVKGDKAARPKDGQGQGTGAASDGDPFEDEFAFTLSREEFLKYFFEDLELPELVEKNLSDTPAVKHQRAGFTTSGNTSSMHVLRSMRGALGRRLAVGSKGSKRLKEAKKELAELLKAEGEIDETHKLELESEIAELARKAAMIPFLDPIDLRYRNTITVPKPSTRAVMFCIMDVSGSMGQEEKDIAKRFFILLYLFLTKSYENIELVFIRHHTTAKEVTEDEFFNSRESGGTVVTSALELTHEILTERYPAAEWNAYIAQASDGDNFSEDSVFELVDEKIMPLVQYFAYVEITKMGPQNLWYEYLAISRLHKNFASRNITRQADIYPVFCDLFKKKGVES